MLLLVTILAGCGHVQSNALDGRYTPRNIWSDEWELDFYEDWFSSHLAAMKEPSLWSLSRAEPRLHTYRILVLPSFNHPFAIRITITRNGRGHLYVTLLDGTGGYDPGDILAQDSRRISRAEVRQVLKEMGELDFWNLSTSQDKTSAVVTMVDGEEVEQIIICGDGTELVLEGVRNGKYHLAEQGCGGNILHDVASMLIALTGMEDRLQQW